jgi:hypothetical protein
VTTPGALALAARKAAPAVAAGDGDRLGGGVTTGAWAAATPLVDKAKPNAKQAKRSICGPDQESFFALKTRRSGDRCNLLDFRKAQENQSLEKNIFPMNSFTERAPTRFFNRLRNCYQD